MKIFSYNRNFAIFTILAMVLLVLGCGKEAVQENITTISTPLVAKNIQEENLPKYYETSGTVKANIVSKVAPKLLGTVSSLYIKSGDYVQAGAILAEIKDEDIVAQINMAKATYFEAQTGLELARQNLTLQSSTYNRYEKLYQEEAISSQQVDEVRNQFEIAKLGYEQAQFSYDKARAGFNAINTNSSLIAPISGVITEKNIELGNMLQPGVPVITIEDNTSFLVECNIEESFQAKINIGLKADFILDNGVKIAGTVVEVVPAIDTFSRSFLVKVRLQGDNLKTGQYGKLLLPIGYENKLAVPKTAIVTKGQLTGVYVIDANKKVWYRLVRLGSEYNNLVEITTGLKNGEMVIIEGLSSVVDGGIAQEVTFQ